MEGVSGVLSTSAFTVRCWLKGRSGYFTCVLGDVEMVREIIWNKDLIHAVGVYTAPVHQLEE